MDEKRIDSYLYGEMPENEREELEDRFIGDGELFAEIADRENDLVDAYVRNELSGDELKRFERSLDAFPARREKLSNAKPLREFIQSERPEAKTITIAERSGFLTKVADVFSFRSPAFQFASIGLILLLGLFSIFLLRENRRLGSLESELAASRQRESELAAQADNAQDATGALTEDLVAERQRIQHLETEIAKLRDVKGNSQTPEANAVKPTIATILLSPVMIRDPGGPRPVERVEIPSGVERISAVLILDDAPASGSVSVKLNGETLARNVRVQTRPNGEKRISVTIPTSRINATQNELTIYDAGDNKLGAGFLFSVSERK
jgi:hypothetical protein